MFKFISNRFCKVNKNNLIRAGKIEQLYRQRLWFTSPEKFRRQLYDYICSSESFRYGTPECLRYIDNWYMTKTNKKTIRQSGGDEDDQFKSG